MTCQDTNNISIRFPRIGLELRPYSVDFRVNREKLDFLDAKFSDEVGEYLKPFTDEAGGALREPQPAEVVMDGVVSHRMYFRPDYVTYGEINCWIQLHDPQKCLTHDVVDYKLQGVEVKDAYRRIIEGANTNGIITGIEFNIPDDATSNVSPRGSEQNGPYVLYDTSDVEEVVNEDNPRVSPFTSVANLWKDYDKEDSYEPTQIITGTNYNIDVSNNTALEAISILNSSLGLSSWCDNNGILQIGLDFFDSAHHVASANDSRVWRYHNAELTPPGSPIKMAIVNGGMIDAPNDSGEDDLGDRIMEVINQDWDQDLIPQGFAQRPDLLDGKVVTIDAPELSRDALEDRAKTLLANEVVNNNTGSVIINPDTSGIEISDWRNVSVGDFIQLIPAEDEKCKDVERQVLLISGVKHQVDGGSWKLKLDVQKWIDTKPDSTLRYFSPSSNNYYDANDDNSVGEEIYTNG